MLNVLSIMALILLIFFYFLLKEIFSFSLVSLYLRLTNLYDNYIETHLLTNVFQINTGNKSYLISRKDYIYDVETWYDPSELKLVYSGAPNFKLDSSFKYMGISTGVCRIKIDDIKKEILNNNYFLKIDDTTIIHLQDNFEIQYVHTKCEDPQRTAYYRIKDFKRPLLDHG